MKKSFFLALMVGFNLGNSQIIKDSVLGKPKLMKEYVVFLNDSKPYQFMDGDSEYGHSVSWNPENLRSNMSDSWFETSFCRYINSETHYLPNRKVSKEYFYTFSGEPMVKYEYLYDDQQRVLNENVDYRTVKSHYKYFYDQNNSKPSFTELKSTSKDDFLKEDLFKNLGNDPLTIKKFDAKSRTDSIFTLTNQYWRNVEGEGYRKKTDSVYRPKLSQIDYYNEDLLLKETKFFNFENNFRDNRSVLAHVLRFEYDEKGAVIKRIWLKNDKEVSVFYYEKGREVKYIDLESKLVRNKVFNKNGDLVEETSFINDKLFYSVKFEFKGNHISKVYYHNPSDNNEKPSKPKEIIFKYKFDKHNNWTEIIKNVDGKDLYKWVRIIVYYP